METFNIDGYLGFSENKRIMEILDKKVICKSLKCILSRKDFIFNFLYDGYIPEYNQEKGCYSVVKPVDDYINTWKITKTEYDFALYLLNNKLNTIQTAKEYILNEQNRKLKEDEEFKKKLQEEEKIKEKEEHKQNEFNYWLEKEIKNYNNIERIKIVNDIFLDINGKGAEEYGIKLLVLIENIDNLLCKKYLKEILHNNNQASIKTFFQITGLKTPIAYKKRMEFIDSVNKSDYKNTIPYKRKRIHCSEFYILNNKGNYVKALGEPLNLSDFELFYNEINNTLTFKKCGTIAVSGISKEDCINRFNNMIKEAGADEIKKRIEKSINKYGLCPEN